MKNNKSPEQKQVKGFSRRQLLALSGLAGASYLFKDPLQLFFASLTDGLISKAQAVTMAPRNYVVVLFNGGPTRWMWDNFLTPNGPSDPFMRNKSVNNWLSADNYSGDNSAVQYKAEPVLLANGKTIYLPPLWNRNIPVSGGGATPMNTLLNNAMIIRGVHMQVDIGHVTGPTRVVRPNATMPSIPGVIADVAPTYIPAVATGDSSYNLGDPSLGGYRAPSGSGITLINDMGDPLNSVMSSFQNTDSKVSSANLSKMRTYMNDALKELGTYASQGRPGSEALYTMRNQAENLFYKSFGNLTDTFSTLYKKYSDLAVRCSRTAIPNIIPTSGSGGYSLSSGDSNTDLAAHFAVTEFLLANGLSTTVTITAGQDIRCNGLFNYNDEHDQKDRQLSMICHSYQFLVVATLINELKRALGSAIWGQTVVEVSAEYDRSPKDSQTGSDHAPEANTMSFFSGAITQPIFLGNIQVDSRGGDYLGTWGAAAPVITDFNSNGIIITNEHVGSTAATLLGVQSPLRAESLISMGASGPVPLAEGPKNVA